MTEPLSTENQVTESPSDQVTLIKGGLPAPTVEFTDTGVAGAYFDDAEFTMHFIQGGNTVGTFKWDKEAKEFTFDGDLDNAAEILFAMVINQLKEQKWTHE